MWGKCFDRALKSLNIQHYAFAVIYCVVAFVCWTFPGMAWGDEGLRVRILLSVDWEGDTLHEANIAAMEQFQQKFPNYPVIHFLNAAYYTKQWPVSEEWITAQIRRTLKAKDELGVHIHAWEHFVRASGVRFRSGPSFWNNSVSMGRNGELGDDVPLSVYDFDEVRQMLRLSREVLEGQGFLGLESFRGGGWVSSWNIQKALLAEGFRLESSAVPVEIVEQLYPHTLLSRLSHDQWGGISKATKPFMHANGLVQFPNNVGLADYLDENELFAAYLELLDGASVSGGKEVYLHFGWHQETAAEAVELDAEGRVLESKATAYLERVKKGLRRIEAHAQQYDVEVVPSGFRDYPIEGLGWETPSRLTEEQVSCLDLLRAG